MLYTQSEVQHKIRSFSALSWLQTPGLTHYIKRYVPEDFMSMIMPFM